jgi:hypothetical protein
MDEYPTDGPFSLVRHVFSNLSSIEHDLMLSLPVKPDVLLDRCQVGREHSFHLYG